MVMSPVHCPARVIIDFWTLPGTRTRTRPQREKLWGAEKGAKSITLPLPGEAGEAAEVDEDGTSGL